MKIKLKNYARHLWLSLLLLVGVTAIAVPGLNETNDPGIVEIGTVEQLKAFRDAVNSGNTYAGTTVKLTADLDLSGEGNWTPIGNVNAYPGHSFNGTFDGQNHIISNVTSSDNTPIQATAGLFGSVVNGTIKNLTVKNVNITSTHYAAGIVGYTSNKPTIENCKVIGGTITSSPELVGDKYDGGNKIGGIMGYATAGSTITGCWVEGLIIKGYREVGGIVGYSNGTVLNNTVKNITVEQDLSHDYKTPTPITVKDLVGDGSAASNPEANGNKVIKSVFVAQIGEKKYESLEAAFAEVKDGETITMLTDVTISDKLVLALEGKSVILNLGENTLNGRTNLTSGNLTIKNGKVAGGSKQALNVYGSATSAENYSVLTIAEDVTVTADVYGVSMFGATAGGDGYGAVVNIAGTVTTTGDNKNGAVFVSGNLGHGIANDMNNVINVTGTITSDTDAAIALVGNATVNVKSGAKITGNTGIAVKRGVLNVEEGATVHATGAENLNPGANNNGTEMTGAAISMTDTYNNYGAMSVNITGGTFTSDNTDALFKKVGNYTNDATYAVSGGTFSSAVPAEFCAEGYIPADLGDGKYSVKEGVFVAQIGTQKYETLQAAIEAATDEANTITLLADIELGSNHANITKAVTINGEGHTINSTATQAIAISGAGNVTITNAIVSAMNRGINVLDVNTGFTLDVVNSTIQSQVNDPTTTYTTGNDSRGINVANADGVTINITNSIIQGFSYDINIPGSGKNLAVNMTGGKTYGRAIVNNWGSNNNFTLNGVEVHGLNNQTGSTEAFSCIVENEGVKNNNYAILDCQFIATLSEAAMTTSGSSATEQMMSLRGENATVKVLGNTTYTCNSEERGGFIDNEGALFTNKLYFDDTTKATFADAFKEAVIAEEKDAEVGLYPVTYTPEVYYYWFANGIEDGGYYDLAQPFINGWLDNGEFIRLKKDVVLTSNLIWAKENASFTMTFGDFKVTKGEYSVALKQGVTVNTDKQTDIFSAADANFKVVETAVEGGYTYTVAAKDFVAQIGEGEDAVKYESLAEAVEAAGTETTTIKMLANASSDQITIPADKNIVIDFAGYTVTPTGKWLIINKGALTLSNTAEGAGGITSTFKGLVDNYGTLTVNSGTYSTTAEIAFWNNDENSTITVNGGSVSSSAIVIVAENNSIVNVAGGTITATGEESYGIRSTSSKVNVSGGKVTAATQAIHLQESSTATISGDAVVEVTGEETWGIVVLSNSTLTVKDNATITSSGFAISGNGNEGEGGTTVNIEGGTVTGGSAGIYQPQSGKLNITGGTISGETGVYVKSGELSVTGGAINGTGAKADYNFNGNGANPTGDALVIDNCGYPGGAPTASVTGGTFTSSNATAVGSYATTGNTTIGNFVSGGYFNTELPDDICAIGKKTVTSTEKEGYYEIADKDYVAQIGEGENAVKYETLEEAWNAVNDGETITLLANCEGNGLIAPQGKFTNGLTVDFAGFTYTVDGSTVGSAGTETNAFQLLKDNKITFKNGTITSEKAKILVQNYSNLTLEGMTLTLDNANYASAYTLSNNNGNVVIDGTTINANPAGGFAFDVCRYSSYPSVSVTVTGNSEINGDVEVSASGSEAKDGFNLMFESATLNGEIVLDETAKTAMANTPDKAEVSKNNELTDIVAPDGYDWKDNGDGTSSLALTEEMEMVLIDGETCPVKATAKYKTVTYRRTFADKHKDKYQGWYVPFDYTIKTEDLENFDFYKIHLIAASAEESGEVTNISRIFIHIESVAEGYVLKANKPYFVVPKTTGTFEFTPEGEGVIIYAPVSTSRLHLATSEFDYNFYGNYDAKMYATKPHDWLMMSGGQICWNADDSNWIPSYRWYIKVEANNSDADYSKIGFSIVGEDDATSIDSVHSMDNSDIEGYYTINGLKLEKPVKGINIIRYNNGKTRKVILK